MVTYFQTDRQPASPACYLASLLSCLPGPNPERGAPQGCERCHVPEKDPSSKRIHAHLFYYFFFFFFFFSCFSFLGLVKVFFFVWNCSVFVVDGVGRLPMQGDPLPRHCNDKDCISALKNTLSPLLYFK